MNARVVRIVFVCLAGVPAAVVAVAACSGAPPLSSPDSTDGGPDASLGGPGSDASPTLRDGGDAAPDASLRDAPAGDATPGDAAPGAGDSASGQDASGFSCSGAAPSLANAVFPILQGRCNGELCHGGTALGAFGGAANVRAQLVNVPSTRDMCDAGVLVSPGSLDRSYLLNKLTGVGMCPGSSRMPLLGIPLAPADIQTIADWICTRAPNN